MDPYLTRALQMTPRLIEREVRAAGPERYDVRPDPARFSLREVIAHLEDWEPIMLGRIRTGVETPGGPIQAYDESRLAVEHDYASKEPLECLDRWKAKRETTIAYVGGLANADFAKTVVHSERGEMIVADLAHMIVSHDVYHLQQAAEMSTWERVADVW